MLNSKLNEKVKMIKNLELKINELKNQNKYANDLNLELGIAMGYIDSLTEKGFIQVKVMKDT